MKLKSTEASPFAVLHRPYLNSTHTLNLNGYLQSKNYNCGFASVLMILRYFKSPIGNVELYKKLGTNRSGTSQTSIIQTLRHFDIGASVRYDLSIDTILKCILSGKPLIAYLKGDEHWVVIYGCDVDRQSVLVADPRPGYRCEWSWNTIEKDINHFGIVCSHKQKLKEGFMKVVCTAPQLEFNLDV